jgi:hypothetical protein
MSSIWSPTEKALFINIVMKRVGRGKQGVKKVKPGL